MKRLAAFTLILFLSVGESVAQDQTLTLTRETRLYARPDSTSEARATLPSALQLTLISEQEDWLAVSTASGLVGWIPRRVTDRAGGGDEADSIDDLIDDIRDARREDAPPAPPPVREEQPDVPPPPRDVSPDVPLPAPPSPQVEEQPIVPPPPPPRPPSRRDSEPVVRDEPQSADGFGSRGFYNTRKWSRIQFRMTEQSMGLGIAWARLMGRVGEFSVWVNGAAHDGDALPAEVIDAAAFKSLGEIVVDPDETLYGFETGLAVNLFLMQPGRSPVGFYVGGLLNAEQFFATDLVNGNFTQGQVGGEAGLYMHGGSGDVLWIPRVAYRMVRDLVVYDGETVREENVSSVHVGLEARFRTLAPGVFLDAWEDTQRVTLALTFAF